MRTCCARCAACTHTLPVVVCTGFSASMTPERAYELGAAGYLTKPLSVNELALQVRRILDLDTATSR